MTKLIIVDDEKVTRESLRDYIPWAELGIESVRTARNGTEALALCESDRPSIVLTDIRMPKMDGLQLAERIREIEPRCKIVFLSGYADKEYLKRAIQLQATSYVEKPVDRDEVKAAVRAAVRAWESEESRLAVPSHGKPAYEPTLNLVKDEISRCLVSGDPKARNLLAAYQKELPSYGSDTPLTVVAVGIRQKAGTDGGLSYARSVVLQAVHSEPFSLPSTLAGFVDDDLLTLIIPRKLTESHTSFAGAFEKFAADVRTTSAGTVEIRIGVGLPCSGVGSLPETYRSALQSLSLGFFRETQDVFYPENGRIERFIMDSETFSEFRVSLERADYPHASETVSKVVDNVRASEPLELDSVRNAFFELYLAVLDVVWKGTPAQVTNKDHHSYVWQEIHDHHSLSELSRFVMNYVRLSIGQTNPGSRVSSRIREIRSYVHNNFSDPNVSLQTIADHVGLSRTYVSSLFKEATGENVMEYLTRVRIDWAKELLADPRITASAVAARIGLNDPGYFSALFKRRVGVTPSAYRKRQ